MRRKDVARSRRWGIFLALVFSSLPLGCASQGQTSKEGAVWGQLFRPEGTGPFPAVILMHGSEGLAGNRSRNYVAYASKLAAEGYVALVLDSFGPRGMVDMERWSWEVSEARYQDALGAAALLRGIPYVAGDRLAVVGWSDGGRTVLKVAQQAPQGFRVAIGIYPSCYKITGESLQIPVQLHLAGKEDWPGPVECEARGFTRLGLPHEVHIYAGAFHGFDHPGRVHQGWRGTVGYDPNAMRKTWEGMRAFLAKHLRQ